MNRREFISLLGGAAVAWPIAARAQQPAKVPHIDFLDLGPASRVEALRGGLRQLGYIASYSSSAGLTASSTCPSWRPNWST
jgi:putative tryptophan/tyrosine transport system substrate-binding protein